MNVNIKQQPGILTCWLNSFGKSSILILCNIHILSSQGATIDWVTLALAPNAW